MGRPRKHNWRKLLDTVGGDSFEFTLVQGVDYDCSDRMMIQELRNHASSHGGVVLTIPYEHDGDEEQGEVRVFVDHKISAPKRNKYGAVKTKADGVMFDSKKEAARYNQLKLLLDADKISNLSRQPVFPIIINGVKCGKYIADFSYLTEDGILKIEDTKGMRTAVYKLKKRIIEAMYSIEIVET